MKNKKLGVNFESLLNDFSDLQISAHKDSSLIRIPLSACHKSSFQPRGIFNEDTIEQLSNSIEKQGVIQPIVVREKAGEQQQYEIIAGERRVLASRKAGLETIPAIVRDIDDQTAMTFALIENIQRESLTIVDQALGMKRMLENFDLTHQQLAAALGKSRSAVSNTLRLLDLESGIIRLLQENKIQMGHARCLLVLKPFQQLEIGAEVLKKQWSVRQTEQCVQKIQNNTVSKRQQIIQKPKELDFERRLKEHFKMPVSVQTVKKNQGRMVIGYRSESELDSIIKAIFSNVPYE